MSIEINKSKCIGCGGCRKICPGGLIRQDADKKAYIKYPRDCWGCASCLKECPAQAINLYLGADMGGAGSRMRAEISDDIIKWIITKPTGQTEEININRKESNKY
ncbi:MAG: 4Fe-4S binding protein [Oscillospiraceae bacterium]|nr:4Fe-4S binding protein [Oscillospiraceae bacterium]